MNPAKDRKLSRLALNVLGVFEAVGLVIITLATLVAGAFEVKTMIDAGMDMMFYTFSGHHASCAIADKVLEIMEREELVAQGLVVQGMAADLLLRGNGARHARVCRLLRTKGVCP